MGVLGLGTRDHTEKASHTLLLDPLLSTGPPQAQRRGWGQPGAMLPRLFRGESRCCGCGEGPCRQLGATGGAGRPP